MKYAEFGSVSHGTLRAVDLLETFANELDTQIRRQPKSYKRAGARKLIREAIRVQYALEQSDEDCSDEASETMYALQDALSEFAPPYGYFGAHPGDGSDFGYWLSEDALEDFDGLKVSDSGDVPSGYRGEVLHVSDHGNPTLYYTTTRGLREVWSLV